ncbi:response regulator transcription factor [Agaribacterium haliotis]|uniref:response regulator transcription factor n=1 Tax=Agaribacterium haliotis TaxID=2013869 RepID=UPI000BB54433|nr:response regulator transcription factor [Agaribacterium haliotis]
MALAPGNILVVEDDAELNQQISQLVSAAGYRADACFDGQSALLLAAKNNYDLVLLDLMLPELDGLTLLSMLRTSSQVPVMVVSAKGAEQERIIGLRQGADDYISKPFNATELLLRVEAILRRSQTQQSIGLMRQSICGLNLQLDTKKVFFEQLELNFTPIQFKLLWELALHRGKVLSKAYLYQQVLSRSLEAHDRSLDMHFSRIRRKLKQAGWRDDQLQTVHGKGYCLK